MTLEIAHALWDEFKGYINPNEMKLAAEALVDILVHHDVEASEIYDEFVTDSLVRKAASDYIDAEEHEDDDEEDWDEDDDEEDGY